MCWGESGPHGIRELWLDTLGLLGPAEGPAKVMREREKISEDGEYGRSGFGWASVTHRKMWPGADRRAVEIHGRGAKNYISWWRYLASHTAKSKKEQLGWQGRQWGVVNGRNERPHP